MIGSPRGVATCGSGRPEARCVSGQGLVRNAEKLRAAWTADASAFRSRYRCPRALLSPSAQPYRMLVLARPPFTLPVGLVQPRIATVPSESGAWVHEIKFDGYRILAHVDGARVKLVTRPGNDWTSRAPGVVDALGKLGARGTLLDGEAVLLHADGTPNFFGLSVRLPRERAYAIAYVAFDLLYLDGQDVREWTLLERREALRQLVRPTRDEPHLSVSEAFEAPGSAVYEAACRIGAEGIVSKLRASRYRAGRNGDWVKVINPAYRRR